MDEICSHWQELYHESKAPRSYCTKIVSEGAKYLLILPDELMEEGGFAIGDQFEVSLEGEKIVFTKLSEGESS